MRGLSIGFLSSSPISAHVPTTKPDTPCTRANWCELVVFEMTKSVARLAPKH